ncbi:MAG: hypothetical protein MUE84_13050 [Hyphomonas sp.]|nr:hypothetical protein [Hyphomonas sp.]
MTKAVRLVALAGCIVAITLLPKAVYSALEQAEARTVMNGALDQQTFAPETLSRLLDKSSDRETIAACDTERLRLDAALRLNQWQQLPPGPQRNLSAARLDATLDLLLLCTPTLGFWWLVRADLALTEPQEQDTGLSFLRRSWSTTPREGWIGTMRSRVAFSHIRRLTAEDRDRAVAEVRSLLEAGITEHVEVMLQQGDGSVRTLVATIIADLERGQRAYVLRRLERRGIADIWQAVSPQARPGDAQQASPTPPLSPAFQGRPAR